MEGQNESDNANELDLAPTPEIAVNGPLCGTVCLVETFNEDGINDNGSHETTLCALGATISTQLGEHLTHYIVSFPSTQVINHSNKRILAAELLGIPVVSPLWVEQCREANQLIPVAEFTIKGSLFAATTAQKHVLSTEQGSGTESAAIEASHIAEHQPKLNSSHNDCPSSGNEMLQTDQLSSSKRALSCPSKLAELGAAASSSNTSYLQAAGKAGSSISSLNGTSSAVVAEMASEVVIPLPTFREYVAPVVPLTVLEIAQKRRRSERISDLMEDDSDEEVLQGTDCIHYEGNGHHAKKSKMDFESWEAVRNIPIDLSIPIIYLPGEEGDKLPPFVLTKSACHSTTAKGGSGIKGLDHKGKKVPHHLSKAHKKSASGPSSKAYQPKSGSSGGVVGSKPKAKSSNEEYTPNYYNVTDSKGRFVKADALPQIEPSRSKVVIALTGFDDKSGDRSTLLHMLRQLIKTIKKRAASGGGGTAVVLPAAASSSSSAVARPAISAAVVKGKQVESVVATEGDGALSFSAAQASAAQASAAQACADAHSAAVSGISASNSAESSGSGDNRGNGASSSEGSAAAALATEETDQQSDVVFIATIPAPAVTASVLSVLETVTAEANIHDTSNGDGGDATSSNALTEIGEVKRGRGRPRTSSMGSVASSTTAKAKSTPTPTPTATATAVPTASAGVTTAAAPTVPTDTAGVTTAASPTAFVSSASAAAEDRGYRSGEGGACAASVGGGAGIDGASPVKRGRGRPRLNSYASSIVSIDGSAGGGSGGGHGGKVPKAWYIEALECSVTILTDPNDFSASSCTHVIVNTKSATRTLRTLFALARGLCILTEEWVYQSVSREAWAETSHFLHPRYQPGPERRDFRLSANVFRGKKILLLDSVNPPTEVLIDLVEASGARVAATVDEAGISFVVFGDVATANEWVASKLRKKKSCTHREVADMRGHAEKRKIVTAKYLFNCIEEMKMRPAMVSDGEVISLEHLLVFNYTDRHIQDSSQQAFAQAVRGEIVDDRSRVPLSPKAAAAEVKRTRSAQKAPPANKEYVIPDGAARVGAGCPGAGVGAGASKSGPSKSGPAVPFPATAVTDKCKKSAVTEVRAGDSGEQEREEAEKQEAVVIEPPAAPFSTTAAALVPPVPAVAPVAPVAPVVIEAGGLRKSSRRAALAAGEPTSIAASATATSPAAPPLSAYMLKKLALAAAAAAAAAQSSSSQPTVSAQEEEEEDAEAERKYQLSCREQRAQRRNSADSHLALTAATPAAKVKPNSAKKAAAAAAAAAAAVVSVAAPVPAEPSTVVMEPGPMEVTSSEDKAEEPVPPPEEFPDLAALAEAASSESALLDITACDVDHTAFTISHANIDDTIDLADISMDVVNDACGDASPAAWGATQHSSAHSSRYSSPVPSPAVSAKSPIDLDTEVEDDMYLETCNRTSNTQLAVSSLLELSSSKTAMHRAADACIAVEDDEEGNSEKEGETEMEVEVVEEWTLADAVAGGAFDADQTMVTFASASPEANVDSTEATQLDSTMIAPDGGSDGFEVGVGVGDDYDDDDDGAWFDARPASALEAPILETASSSVLVTAAAAAITAATSPALATTTVTASAPTSASPAPSPCEPRCKSPPAKQIFEAPHTDSTAALPTVERKAPSEDIDLNQIESTTRMAPIAPNSAVVVDTAAPVAVPVSSATTVPTVRTATVTSATTAQSLMAGATVMAAAGAVTESAAAVKKRKSEFVDPYADYEPAKATHLLPQYQPAAVHTHHQQPLQPHRQQHQQLSAIFTHQQQQAAQHMQHQAPQQQIPPPPAVPRVPKPLYHSSGADPLDDDIVDDSSTEGRSLANSRGRVGGTAPFRQSLSVAPISMAATPASASNAGYYGTLTGSAGKARMRLPSAVQADLASAFIRSPFPVPGSAGSSISTTAAEAAAAQSKGLLRKKGVPVRPIGGSGADSDSDDDLQFTPAAAPPSTRY